jgi:hypothetical protein
MEIVNRATASPVWGPRRIGVLRVILEVEKVKTMANQHFSSEFLI